jgi:hypothetical protein
LIVSAFSFFFFFFQYMGSHVPRSTSSTTRRARSSTKHLYCARIIHFYIVLFLIATFPSAILADGGGSGECIVSFAPPTPQYDPSSSGVVRSKAFLYDEACPPRERAGRRNQAAYRTEFIFLNSSGWPQATELLNNVKASILNPKPSLTNTTRIIGLAETHLLAPEFVDKSHTISGEGWQSLGAPAVKTELGGCIRGGRPYSSKAQNLFTH